MTLFQNDANTHFDVTMEVTNHITCRSDLFQCGVLGAVTGQPVASFGSDAPMFIWDRSLDDVLCSELLFRAM